MGNSINEDTINYDTFFVNESIDEHEEEKEDDYYQCKCENEPECFINYYKFKAEYIRKNNEKTIKYHEWM